MLLCFTLCFRSFLVWNDNRRRFFTQMEVWDIHFRFLSTVTPRYFIGSILAPGPHKRSHLCKFAVAGATDIRLWAWITLTAKPSSLIQCPRPLVVWMTSRQAHQAESNIIVESGWDSQNIWCCPMQLFQIWSVKLANGSVKSLVNL